MKPKKVKGAGPREIIWAKPPREGEKFFPRGRGFVLHYDNMMLLLGRTVL
jgi:hypothetical protein